MCERVCVCSGIYNTMNAFTNVNAICTNQGTCGNQSFTLNLKLSDFIAIYCLRWKAKMWWYFAAGILHIEGIKFARNINAI